MKTLSTTATIAAVLLFTIASAFASQSPGAFSAEDAFSTDGLPPVTITLFNDPDMGDSDTVSLLALNASDTGAVIELEYYQDWNDNWYAFDQDFGRLFDNMISLVSLYSPTGSMAIGLRLTDGDGAVISQMAEVTFHNFESEFDGSEWFNWVSFDWLDNAGVPIDVTTILTAGLPWDTGDMVGRPVPIPSAALLLSFGLFILIGRRHRRI